MIPKWLFISVLLIGVVAMGEAVMIWRLDSQLKGATKKIERLSDRFADIAYEEKSADRTEPPTVNNTQLQALELRINAVSQRLEALDSGDVDEAQVDVEEVVNRKLGEKMMAAVGFMRNRAQINKYVNVVGKRLSLTPDQKVEVGDIVGEARKTIFEMSKKAGQEDMEIVQEINTLMKTKMPRRKKVRQIREALSSSSPPGSDETYLDMLVNVRAESLDDLSQVFTEEQFNKFTKLRLSPFAGVGGKGKQQR